MLKGHCFKEPKMAALFEVDDLDEEGMMRLGRATLADQEWKNSPEKGDMGCQASPRYTTPLSWLGCGSLSMQG